MLTETVVMIKASDALFFPRLNVIYQCQNRRYNPLWFFSKEGLTGDTAVSHLSEFVEQNRDVVLDDIAMNPSEDVLALQNVWSSRFGKGAYDAAESGKLAVTVPSSFVRVDGFNHHWRAIRSY